MRRLRREINMGLGSLKPTEFNIDPKLRLKDPLKLVVEGQLVSRHIEQWIEVDPVRLWHKIYRPALYYQRYSVAPGEEREKLALCHNAHKLLTAAIKGIAPDLLADMQQRKKERALLAKHRKGQLKPLNP